MKTKIANYIIGLIFLIYYCICIYNSYLQLVFYKNGWYFDENFLAVHLIFLILLFYIDFDWRRRISIFFTLLKIFFTHEQQLVSTLKKNIIAVITIAVNSSWKIFPFTAGFLTFPALNFFLNKTQPC